MTLKGASLLRGTLSGPRTLVSQSLLNGDGVCLLVLSDQASFPPIIAPMSKCGSKGSMKRSGFELWQIIDLSFFSNYQFQSSFSIPLGFQVKRLA
ncbi:hypothetical protein V6N13_020746 [Hibiscus sabdariffa]